MWLRGKASLGSIPLPHGEVGALLADQLLNNSSRLKSYGYRLGIKSEWTGAATSFYSFHGFGVSSHGGWQVPLALKERQV